MILKKIILSVFCSLIIVLTPCISAVEYDSIKQEFKEQINELSINKIFKNDEIININDVESSGLILNLLVFLLSIFLNLVLVIFNLIGSFIKILFSIAVNLLSVLIKTIIRIASLFEPVIDVIAIIVTGLFGILINAVIGLFGIIKDIIIELLTPDIV
jgi:hypothetical protein